MEKEDLILSLLRESRADQKTTTHDIAEMKIDVALNRQDLQDHMEQTKIVKQIALDNKDHFEQQIAEVRKKQSLSYLLKAVVTVASGVGIVTGAIYGVLRLFH